VRTEAEGELGRNEANQRARLHRVEEGRRVLDLISKAVNAGQGRSKPSTHAEVVAQNLFTTIVIMAEQGNLEHCAVTVESARRPSRARAGTGDRHRQRRRDSIRTAPTSRSKNSDRRAQARMAVTVIRAADQVALE